MNQNKWWRFFHIVMLWLNAFSVANAANATVTYFIRAGYHWTWGCSLFLFLVLATFISSYVLSALTQNRD